MVNRMEEVYIEDLTGLRKKDYGKKAKKLIGLTND